MPCRLQSLAPSSSLRFSVGSSQPEPLYQREQPRGELRRGQRPALDAAPEDAEPPPRHQLPARRQGRGGRRADGGAAACRAFSGRCCRCRCPCCRCPCCCCCCCSCRRRLQVPQQGLFFPLGDELGDVRDVAARGEGVGSERLREGRRRWFSRSSRQHHIVVFRRFFLRARCAVAVQRLRESSCHRIRSSVGRTSDSLARA